MLFFDGKYRSKDYEITTLPKPNLIDFTAELSFPKYLGKASTQLKNTGDIIVPEGTHIKWLFITENTDRLIFIHSDSTMSLSQSGENEFLYANRFYKSERYGLSTSNEFLQNEDTVYYSLEVVPDLFPSISVEAKSDSSNPKMKYFKGLIKDDYGFSKLVFHTQYISKDGSLGTPKSEYIPINRSVPQTDFFHAWNTSSFSLNAGDRIDYFFEVWDNDGVNGNKPSRTQKFSFKAPSIDELQKKNDKK